MTGAAPGSTVSFSGTLTNTGAATIYINGDTVTSPSALDDTPFFLNAPASLSAGASVGPFIVFTVQIPTGAAVGTVFSGTFDILGGLTPLSADVLATQGFRIVVGDPVPEPATLMLLGTGLAGIGGMIKRRRQGK